MFRKPLDGHRRVHLSGISVPSRHICQARQPTLPPACRRHDSRDGSDIWSATAGTALDLKVDPELAPFSISHIYGGDYLDPLQPHHLRYV